MNNELLLKYYSNMKKVLECILNNNKIINSLSDEIFLNVILDYLSSFGILEKKVKSSNDDTNIYLEKINGITNKKNFLNNTVIDLNSESQIKDIDKYLRNSIKNTININLDDLLSNSKSSYESNNQNYEQKNGETNQYNYNLKDSIERMIIQKAFARIKEDEIKGNYYFYDSKPPQIPIIKLAISIILIISLITFFSIMIIDFSIMIISGVKFNVSLFFSLMFPVVLICLGVSFLLKQLKRKKSDNEKYHFSFIFYVILIILGLFSLISNLVIADKFSGMNGYLWLADSNPTNLQIRNYRNFLNNNNNINESLKKYIEDIIKDLENLYSRFNFNAIYKSRYSLYIISSSLLIMLAVPTSIGYIYKPKRNIELHQKILNEYIEEARKQFEKEKTVL